MDVRVRDGIPFEPPAEGVRNPRFLLADVAVWRAHRDRPDPRDGPDPAEKLDQVEAAELKTSSVRSPVVATLTLGGYASASCASSTASTSTSPERELRLLDAKTPAGVRRVDIYDDLQEELAAYTAARGETWQPGEPAFRSARGKRWTRNAIAQHPARPRGGNRQRGQAGLPAIRDDVTPYTLRYTCIASLVAAGADQEYVSAQVGHEDVATTNRIYRHVLQRRQRGEIGRRRQLAMHESAAEVGAPEGVATGAQAR